MKRLLVLLCFVTGAAHAQAISGSFTASFNSFNSFGVPSTHFELRLMCSLTCTRSAPTLHYRVSGLTDAWYASALTTKVGYFGSGFGSDDTGVNVIDSEQFPAGIAFKAIAKSASCHCGNAVGQGGYVDLETPVTVIPPWVQVSSSNPKAGFSYGQIVNAQPQGNETVEVRLLGAGVDSTLNMGPTDFTSSGTGLVNVTPTQAGTLAVTAKLMPYGASYSVMVTVVDGSGGTGGGSGGSGTGGGGTGGGGDTPEDPGCSSAPGLGLLALAALSLMEALGARKR